MKFNKISIPTTRMWLVLLVVLPLIISISPLRAQGAGPAGACAATGEQLYGQGGFAFAGQGGFAFAGQGGFAFAGQDGGTMEEPTGTDLTEIQRILEANTIEADWVNIHANSVGAGGEPVGIIIWDDFSQTASHGVWVRRIIEEMYQVMLQQFLNGESDVPPPPLVLVNLPLNEIDFDVNRVGETGYDPVAIMEREHEFVRYTTGVADPTTEIVNNWINNLSFALVPCQDSDIGWRFSDPENPDFIGAFNNAWTQWLEVNPNRGTPNYSLFDYLINDTGIFDGDFSGAALYLQQVMSSDTNEDFQRFESYLESLLQIEGKNVVSIASAGNYREWQLTEAGFECSFDPQDERDTGDCTPFAPGKFSSTIASVATFDPKPDTLGVPILTTTDSNIRNTQQFVGEDTQAWTSSQDGQILTPGAAYFYDFDGPWVPIGGWSGENPTDNDNWYRLGTSYSAPFLSMGFALQFSHPSLLNCEGAFTAQVPLTNIAAKSKQANSLPSQGVLCSMTDVERDFRVANGAPTISPEELNIDVSVSDSTPNPGDTIQLTVRLANGSSIDFASGVRAVLGEPNGLSSWSLVSGTYPDRGFLYDVESGLGWFAGTIPENEQGVPELIIEATLANPPSSKQINIPITVTANEFGDKITEVVTLNVNGSISGTVQDELGQPAAKVLVSVTPDNIQTCTDSTGQYSFVNRITSSNPTVTAIGGSTLCGIIDYTFLENTSWTSASTTSVNLSSSVVTTGVNLALFPTNPPAEVTNVLPTNDSKEIGSNLVVQWTPVAGASRYRVFVRDEDTAGDYGAVYDDTVQEFTYATATDICTTTTCTFNDNALPSQGRYSIFIQSINSAGTSNFTGPDYFRVGNAPLPPSLAPTITSPARNSTVTDTTTDMIWGTVANATKYDVLVYEYDTGLWVVRDSNINQGNLNCSTECLYHILHTPAEEDNPLIGLTPGFSYALFARAKGPGGYGPYNTAHVINVDAGATPQGLEVALNGNQLLPTVPTVIAPDGFVTISEPVIGWYNTGDARDYRVVVQDAEGNLLVDETDRARDFCNNGTCTLTLSSGLADGEYQVNVMSLNPQGSSAWSEPSVFTIFTEGN